MRKTWTYIPTGIAALAAASLVTPPSASAATEHRIGRGVITAGSIVGEPAPSHALQAAGSLRLRKIGQGQFNWDFDRSCANPDCSATLNSHSFDFVLPDGGELFGGNSADADSEVISVQGVGSLAGWTGHIRLVPKPTRHRERVLAVGDLHFDPKLRCQYLGTPC